MQSCERETSVAFTEADDYVRVYTCIQRDITGMKAKEQFILEKEGVHNDGTPWATFIIPRKKFSIAMAARPTRKMTEEKRKEAGERLNRGRQAKEGDHE